MIKGLNPLPVMTKQPLFHPLSIIRSVTVMSFYITNTSPPGLKLTFRAAPQTPESWLKMVRFLPKVLGKGLTKIRPIWANWIIAFFTEPIMAINKFDYRNLL